MLKRYILNFGSLCVRYSGYIMIYYRNIWTILGKYLKQKRRKLVPKTGLTNLIEVVTKAGLIVT